MRLTRPRSRTLGFQASLLSFFLFLFKKYYLFIYLFILAVLGLSCSMQDLRCGMRTS